MSVLARPTINFDVASFNFDLYAFAPLIAGSPIAYWNKYVDLFKNNFACQVNGLGYTLAEWDSLEEKVRNAQLLLLPIFYWIWGVRASLTANIIFKKKDASDLKLTIGQVEPQIGINRNNNSVNVMTPGRISRAVAVNLIAIFNQRITDSPTTWPLLARTLQVTKAKACYCTFDALYCIGEIDPLKTDANVAELLYWIFAFEYNNAVRLSKALTTKNNTRYKFNLTANITYVLSLRSNLFGKAMPAAFCTYLEPFLEATAMTELVNKLKTFSWRDGSNFAYTPNADIDVNREIDVGVIQWNSAPSASAAIKL